ncbi:MULTISPECIES: hypothetical protein [Thermoactinomyces]|jgi:hypothetical protein|uniref:SHOCT domain-containing protein n=1 Tax=Thermoactinomyces daqus TaxID=1329516 RepID=A0A7W1XAS2_9BACL|nr:MULTISPECIES: hypothetical protein [Thermoactinomyces]MBA4543258.1 hypothetical protein [Thermoactinomyces daqus]MBH8597757.1 hypothetical protein [Thermoactinomyces sp. CICC 10523]MBH8604099.1 hypothetical protein [Thermoactinomyces sp. CICC 10522]MBH8606366.1 hypothetical protein [Thermoactinomyces sp. CICC 10521]
MERMPTQMGVANQITDSPKQISPKAKFRGAVGTLKHEGVHLSKPEQELLLAYCEGRISEEEYDRKALELALKG